MVKEKERFAFEKLELPTKIKEFTHSNQTFLDIPIQEKKTELHKESPSKQFSTQKLIIFGVLGIIILGLITLLIINWSGNQKVKPTKVIAQKIIQTPKPIKQDSTETEKPLKYVNYHDSIIFLNDVKGEKRVISKGYDDYLKKNKLIIKSGNHYFNCFCNDLYENYKVGELIP